MVRNSRAKSKLSRIAKGKTTKLQTLARTVKRIQAQNRAQSEYLNLVQNVDNSNVTAPAVIQNLSYYTGMSGTFGTSTDDFEANKMVHKSVAMDCYVSLENTVNDEESTIGFTAYIVSLQDNIGGYFAPGTGALTLVSGQTHEVIKGMVLLNKKMFKIHKVKRFTLSNHNTTLANPSAQTQYGTDHRWYWKLKLGHTVSNPAGNWKSLSSALDPSKTYYFLLFTDNTSADLESPTLNMTCVHTIKQVA